MRYSRRASIVAVLLGVVFAGCGGGDSNDESATATTEAIKSTTAKAAASDLANDPTGGKDACDVVDAASLSEVLGGQVVFDRPLSNFSVCTIRFADKRGAAGFSLPTRKGDYDVDGYVKFAYKNGDPTEPVRGLGMKAVAVNLKTLGTFDVVATDSTNTVIASAGTKDLAIAVARLLLDAF